jgi:hypothetical protein
MVLDEVGGVPILASWWPLSATAMVHRRDIDGRGVVFGNQGDLYMNAMTWWDHDTSSVWSQPTGEAILGPLKGERWELVPSTLTEWPNASSTTPLPGEPIAIVVRPDDEELWTTFSRQLDDRVARLDLTRDHLVDRRSGERWDPERGLKAEDPSNPEILVQLVATSFPSDYMNFYPSGEVWEPNV